MKTFADVKFTIMNRPGCAGVCGKIPLDNNGLEISIIMNEMSYGGLRGLWEIAVFNKDGQVSLECLDHDVVGFLTFPELEKKIQEIQIELNSNQNKEGE